VHRGVTLLELLIVLVLMGLAAGLVAPMLRPIAASTGAADVAIVAAARRRAVQRAEPLRLRFTRAGAWTVRSVASGEVLDSGSARGGLAEGEWLLDPLGACLPASGSASAAAFDALMCRDARDAAGSASGPRS
jgi:prepilin-type N-terminal cleavage/methylation domain-containing protein